MLMHILVVRAGDIAAQALFVALLPVKLLMCRQSRIAIRSDGMYKRGRRAP